MGRSEIRPSGVERQSCNDQPPTGSKPLRSNLLSDTRCRGSSQAPLFSSMNSRRPPCGSDLRSEIQLAAPPDQAISTWRIITAGVLIVVIMYFCVPGLGGGFLANPTITPPSTRLSVILLRRSHPSLGAGQYTLGKSAILLSQSYKP